MRHDPEVAKKAIAYAESVSTQLPAEADGFGAFISIEDHGVHKLPFAADAWRRASGERPLHTCHDMIFFKQDLGSFPWQSFRRTEHAEASLKRIQESQDNCPILIVPIRIRTRTVESPMLQGEFGFDLTSAIYFLAAQPKSWELENLELACEGERFKETEIPTVGLVRPIDAAKRGDRRIRNLLPNQHEALSLTGFVI